MSSQKAGGNTKAPNKRPGYYTSYYMLRYPRNKLKRILRHNGLGAARSWADKHEAAGILRQLINSGVKVRGVRDTQEGG